MRPRTPAVGGGPEGYDRAGHRAKDVGQAILFLPDFQGATQPQAVTRCHDGTAAPAMFRWTLRRAAEASEILGVDADLRLAR